MRLVSERTAISFIFRITPMLADIERDKRPAVLIYSLRHARPAHVPLFKVFFKNAFKVCFRCVTLIHLLLSLTKAIKPADRWRLVMKALSILALAGLFAAPMTGAFAQTYLQQNFGYYQAYRAHTGTQPNGVYGNGRCGGISYGTGARSCGTATGGPVGGLSGRN